MICWKRTLAPASVLFPLLTMYMWTHNIEAPAYYTVLQDSRAPRKSSLPSTHHPSLFPTSYLLPLSTCIPSIPPLLFPPYSLPSPPTLLSPLLSIHPPLATLLPSLSSPVTPPPFPSPLTNIIKELSPANKLHDHEDMGGRGNDLIQLDNVRMAKQLQNLNLTANLFSNIQTIMHTYTEEY